MKPTTPFLRKLGSCDRMHTHYTHGRWCCRSRSKSAAYTFSGPQVSHLVSIFTPLQDPAPGNRPSPQKQMNSRSASFDVRLSRLVNLVALLNTTLLNSEIPLQRPPERCHTFKCINPTFCFSARKFTKTVFFVSSSQLCVCVSFICSKLSGTAVPHWVAFHLFLICREEWFCYRLIKHVKTDYAAFMTSSNKKSCQCYWRITKKG